MPAALEEHIILLVHPRAKQPVAIGRPATLRDAVQAYKRTFKHLLPQSDSRDARDKVVVCVGEGSSNEHAMEGSEEEELQLATPLPPHGEVTIADESAWALVRHLGVVKMAASVSSPASDPKNENGPQNPRLDVTPPSPTSDGPSSSSLVSSRRGLHADLDDCASVSTRAAGKVCISTFTGCERRLL